MTFLKISRVLRAEFRKHGKADQQINDHCTVLGAALSFILKREDKVDDTSHRQDDVDDRNQLHSFFLDLSRAAALVMCM